MKQLRRFIFALATSVVVIVGMFVSQAVMERRASAWAEMDRVIPLYDRILVDVAAFWSHFWILFVPVIVGFPLLAALLVVGLRAAK